MLRDAASTTTSDTTLAARRDLSLTTEAFRRMTVLAPLQRDRLLPPAQASLPNDVDIPKFDGRG